MKLTNFLCMSSLQWHSKLSHSLTDYTRTFSTDTISCEARVKNIMALYDTFFTSNWKLIVMSALQRNVKYLTSNN